LDNQEYQLTLRDIQQGEKALIVQDYLKVFLKEYQEWVMHQLVQCKQEDLTHLQALHHAADSLVKKIQSDINRGRYGLSLLDEMEVDGNSEEKEY
jgi:hypothetical protein